MVVAVAGLGRGSVTAVTSFRSSLFFSVTLQLIKMKYGGAGGGGEKSTFQMSGFEPQGGAGLFPPTIPSVR